MRILYLSCHSILEYDEVKLFSELGHEVFSHGAYKNPLKPDDNKRPPLEIKHYPHLEEIARKFEKEDLHEELIRWADVIYIMHKINWLIANWEKIKNKIVIWRSIGQSTPHEEAFLREYHFKGVKIVRYSPKERTIPNYAGEDAIIRFYKDEEEFKDWKGNHKIVLNVTQAAKKRDENVGFTIFKNATEGLPRLLIGPNNEDVFEMEKALATYEELKKWLQKARCFFYAGTYPASYTLSFIEALMTGTPIVAIGEKLGNSPFHPYQKTYEVSDIIKNGENGFISDDVYTLKNYCKMLLGDDETASRISKAGRATALRLFSKKEIKSQWKKFFKDL